MAPDHKYGEPLAQPPGAEKSQEIFNEIIWRARKARLVNDRLRIIDATHLQAKADLFRLPEPPPDIPLAQAPGLPDILPARAGISPRLEEYTNS